MSSETVVLNLSDNTLWAPYKTLFSVVYGAIALKDTNAVQDLEVALKRHKPDLICLLKNPPRSHIHREAVKKASSSGIAITGQAGLQILPQSLIDEALIISDMFDLNEITALELLIAGQQQQPRFPGLTRGLVAMLLYYDGRRNLVNALQLLVQAREGNTWTLNLGLELKSVIMKFTDQLKEEGLMMKIIDLLEKMNITEELDLLHRNRALGGPRYRKQVSDLIAEIKQTLAEIIFGWTCQGTLSQEEVQRLISFLSKQTGVNSDGSMDGATLTSAIALLYVMDVSTLQTCDEMDPIVQKFNLVSEPDLGVSIHKQLMGNQDKWQMPGLKSMFQFAWGVTLRTLSQFPGSTIVGKISECLEDDEKTIDTAIENNCFQSFRNLIVKSSIFHNQEFFVKRIHNIITDFIVLMPLKIKELRNRGDEAARIIASHSQEGLEPPSNLSLHFEHLMNLISDLYSKDPLNLELATEFWCPTESFIDQTSYQRPTQRQIALFKFIRIAGDLLPPPLFVPYHQMLTSLSNSAVCAHSCFSMLKMNGKNGSQSSIVSWDHFFATLHRYYSSLHEEVPSVLDMRYAYPQRMHSKGITPQEVQGLIAVLQLIAKVVQLDEIARITLSENPQYVPTIVLLGLVTCSIPASLKAAIINCLAAFATSPEIALNIWQGLEMAQVIPTVKSVSVYHPSGILMELEEVETRMEEYPVTRAMLSLLDALLNHPCPTGLGTGTRQPGIEPYLQFVRDSVLLRCNSRAYKTEGEKWKIMALCCKILEKVLKNSRFHASRIGGNVNTDSNLGSSILSQMLQDSGLLRTILFILDEGARILDQYASVPGQANLEECTFLALKLVNVTLLKQEAFLQQIRDSGCDLLVTALDNLLLNINPRSGQADHLLVIAKYVTYNIFIPKHSMYSVNILNALCSSIQIAQHLVSVFDGDPKESEIILKGFVETLEIDVTSEENTEDKDLQARNKTRQQVLQLILKCLRHPGPNLSHYLLGFNLRKPIAQTEIQEPGVMGSRRTCLHAILSFLDSGGYSSSCPSNIYNCPRSAELAYQLIYVLCTNKDTSGPTLRYLRSTHDFLYRHLQFLPFKQDGGFGIKILSQQSWLLRTLAVELRITSAHHQRSHVQRLLSCLLDDKHPVESGNVDVSLEPSLGITRHSFHSFMKPTSGTLRRKLMQILDSINFHFTSPSIPQWDYFETEEVERILKECEVQEIDGPRLIDVEELHKRLCEETGSLNNASVWMQRPVMMQEISKVLEYAVSCNEAREAIYARRLLFDAWRQITEVLLISCPLEILGIDKRDQMVLEVSQELLNKVMLQDVLPDLMPPASGVILTLMSTLRHNMLASLLKPVPHLTSTNNNLARDGHKSESKLIPLTQHSSLLVVLRAVVECLLKTGTGLQRVRANFYSAFLNLLCIVQKPIDMNTGSTHVVSMLLDEESETRQLRSEYMETILSFGESIMEIICRDACTSHDITKMLSLAVLDVAISLDLQQQWLAFLVSKGYLRHILDSLSKDDEELQNLYNRNSSSYRIFYVFESKMALLTRISCYTSGALALLRNGAIHKLAECRSLDLRPDIPNELRQDSSNWIFPDLLKCYRQMFMGIMRLILSITMTLGTGHREATLQLLEFVVCNSELFSHIIRDPSSLYSIEGLEELNIMSAVLSRASFDDPNAVASDSFLSEQRGHLLLLRQHMLMLLPRLMAFEHSDSQSQNFSGNIDAEISARMKTHRLEIASHILGSCCSVITKAGPESPTSAILFSPHIAEASTPDSYHSTSSTFQKKLPPSIGRSPDLGLLITILYRSASELQHAIDEKKVLDRRLQSLDTLTSDELSEYISPALKQDQPTVQLQREFAKNSLQKLMKYKMKDISVLSYMIESSAFILLKHLEYFLLYCKKQGTPFKVLDNTPNQMRRLQDPSSESPRLTSSKTKCPDFFRSAGSQFDFDAFKSDVQTTINEPFFRKLKSIEQHLSQSRSHVGFLEAIVNRLKRLIMIQIR
ncbi:nuclear pore complex protein Nup205-like [Uloborus diversus]|uniref:nuclear pore complex protein Nup205-like n=1 Tax=Uloborus diversus TaxID=327109 RepID=UPI00240A83EF|nr:nuclear pore complex protein Nup205-like [Uloborus diversus]